MSAGEAGASGALAEGEVYVPDGAIVSFAVDDIDATLARATALGSTMAFPKTAIGETGFVAEITDCEGNRLALQSGDLRSRQARLISRVPLRRR